MLLRVEVEQRVAVCEVAEQRALFGFVPRDLLASFVLALLLVPAGSALAASDEPDDVQWQVRVERARSKALDRSYQPQLPRYASGEPSEGSSRPVAQWDGRRSGDQQEAGARERHATELRAREDRGAMSSLMTMLLWGLVIVMGVLAVFWAALAFARGEPDLALGTEAAEPQQVDAIIERPLDDAEELALRGRFVEAIHTLLLRTLQELVRSAAVRVVPAMTSREILALVPLLPEPRSALSELITAVEWTYFGDEPAGAAEYERCRHQFQVFAAAFRNAGGASAVAV